MAKGTITVFKHNLNVKSLTELAKSISESLSANVNYGYIDDFDFEKYQNNQEPSFQEIKLGTICNQNAKYNLMLTASNYVNKQLLKTNNEDLFNQPAFKKYISENFSQPFTNEWSNLVYYELDSVEQESLGIQSLVAQIYSDFIVCSYSWIPSWWHFLDVFQTTNHDYYQSTRIRDFIEIRNTQRTFAKLFGANELFYICDEGNIRELIDEVANYDELKQNIFQNPKNKIYALSSYKRREFLPFLRKRYMGDFINPKTGEIDHESHVYLNFIIDVNKHTAAMPDIVFDDFSIFY